MKTSKTFLLSCLTLNYRSFTWTHWRSVSLACGLSVSVAKAPSMRMCSVQSTYYTVHVYSNCMFTTELWLCTQWQSFIPSNTVPLDSSAAGIVPSFTWGRRFRKIWMTRASWCLALDGERHTLIPSVPHFIWPWALIVSLCFYAFWCL